MATFYGQVPCVTPPPKEKTGSQGPVKDLSVCREDWPLER